MSVLVIAELSLSKSVRPRKPLVFVQLDMDPSWIDFSYKTQGDICSWGQAARWSLALEFLQLSLRSRIEDRPSHSAAARTAARAVELLGSQAQGNTLYDTYLRHFKRTICFTVP